MDALPKDLKKYITSMITSDEVVKLCSSSSALRKICTSQDYNDVWISKIKKDFGIVYNGSNGYNEYMRLVINYNTQYWALIVTSYPDGFSENIEIKLFPSQEHAIDYVHKLVVDYVNIGGVIKYDREEIKYVLKKNAAFQLYEETYRLRPTKLTKPKI